jgi:hypothetical protein
MKAFPRGKGAFKPTKMAWPGLTSFGFLRAQGEETIKTRAAISGIKMHGNGQAQPSRRNS